MTSCPLCGSSRIAPYLNNPAGGYLRCDGCSLVFLVPARQTGQTQYGKEYIADRGHDRLDSPLARAKRITARGYLKVLERHVAPGRILDIGCSTGLALETARERGWDAFGADVNEDAVAIARERLGPERVVAGDAAVAAFPDGFFRAITMFDVLEHIERPLEATRLVAAKLAAGGALLIVTPDAESPSARLLGRRWPHFFPEHVCLYSRRSLRILLERAGFYPVRWGRASKMANLDMIKRHMACHPESFLAGAAARIASSLRACDGILFPFNIGEMYVIAKKD